MAIDNYDDKPERYPGDRVEPRDAYRGDIAGAGTPADIQSDTEELAGQCEALPPESDSGDADTENPEDDGKPGDVDSRKHITESASAASRQDLGRKALGGSDPAEKMPVSGIEDKKSGARASPHGKVAGTDHSAPPVPKTYGADNRGRGGVRPEQAEAADRPEIDQQAAGVLFDSYSSYVAAMSGSEGKGRLIVEPADGSAGALSAQHVEISASTGADPLRHSDVLEATFGNRTDFDETVGGPRQDWVVIRRGTDDRITVQTAQDIADAPRHEDGSIVLPEYSDDPAALGRAFARLDAILAHHGDGEAPTALPPEAPEPGRQNGQWFDSLGDELSRLNDLDAGGRVYVPAARLGLDPEIYSVKVHAELAYRDDETVESESLCLDVVPNEGQTGFDAKVEVSRIGDGLFASTESGRTALEELGFVSQSATGTDESANTAEAGVQNPGAVLLSTSESLRLIDAALGLQDISLSPLTRSDDPLEAALAGEAYDVPYANWRAGAEYVESLRRGSSSNAADGNAAYAESQAPATWPQSPEAGTDIAPDGREFIEVTEAEDTAENRALREAGLEPEFIEIAGSTSLLQLTGKAVGRIFDNLREKLETSTTKRDNKMTTAIEIFRDKFTQIRLLETTFTDRPQPVYHLQSALSVQAVEIMKRADERRDLRAAAAARGVRAFMQTASITLQSLSDVRSMHIIARDSRGQLRYEKFRAGQIANRALAHSRTSASEADVRRAVYRIRHNRDMPDRRLDRTRRVVERAGRMAARQSQAAYRRAQPAAGRYTRIMLEFRSSYPAVLQQLINGTRAVDSPEAGDRVNGGSPDGGAVTSEQGNANANGPGNEDDRKSNNKQNV